MAAPRHILSSRVSPAARTSERFRRWAVAGSAAFAGWMLIACQATTPTATPAPQPGAATPSQSQALRVIVKFKQPVAYADPAFLGGLSRQVGAQISYLASIAPDTHAYLIVPQGGQDGAELLSRLSAQPNIAWAEEDRKARPFR